LQPRTLILHSKAPLAGFSKSRLVDARRGLDPERVASLCEAFLRDTLAACRAAGTSELVFHYTPTTAANFFRELDPHALLEPQIDAPFGDRMRGAFERAFARGRREVVLVVTDTPEISAPTIERAFTALAKSDAVLGPASDGGYYLIGMRRRCDHVFEAIDWSTERVAGQTRERARESGFSLAELDPLADVDTPADLDRLRAILARDPSVAPNTARCLATLGPQWSIEDRDRAG
jgi:hypothetical protein